MGMPLRVKIWGFPPLGAYLIKITPFNGVWRSLSTHQVCTTIFLPLETPIGFGQPYFTCLSDMGVCLQDVVVQSVKILFSDQK